MKFLLYILLTFSFIYPQSKEKIPPKIQQEINRGIDYYNLSLYEDSKKIFLDILYSDEGKKYEAEIRYHLGLSSLYERNFADTKIQWKLLIKKFPQRWKGRFDSPAGITGISQVVGKFSINSDQRLELECLYSKVYKEGNILKADVYIFFSTIILLLLKESSAYRSFNSAKNILNTCLKK